MRLNEKLVKEFRDSIEPLVPSKTALNEIVNVSKVYMLEALFERDPSNETLDDLAEAIRGAFDKDKTLRESNSKDTTPEIINKFFEVLDKWK